MGVLQDLKLAWRVLLRKPLFTIVVITTLALGIGANSAMFSIIHRLLYEPVDFPDRDRVVAIQEARKGQDFDEVSPRSFLDWQEQTTSYDTVAAAQFWEVAITGDGDPEQILTAQVSPGYFGMFGVKPLLGRLFARDEVDGQNERVAILSHAFWQRRYGGDREIVGKSVVLDDLSYVVVGVMGPDFRLPTFAELWAPLTLTKEQRLDRRGMYLGAYAHLKPGVTVAQADAEIRAIGERHAQQFPDSNTGRRTRAVGLVHSLTEEFTRDFIWVIGGAGLFVLLITCANVANVFLAHALARRKEIAVRAALGAGRGRVVRQLLTEAMVLGVAGGALSLLVAQWVVDLVKGAIPPTTTRFIAGWSQMGVDPYVLGFALAVGVVVGVLFGVAPALQVSRTDVGAALKEGDRGSTAGPRTQKLRSVLVVAQVALALSLLISAGATVAGFRQLASAAFDPDGVLALRVTLPEGKYKSEAENRGYQRAVLDQLRALPGAREVSAVNNIPWGRFNQSVRYAIEGQEVSQAEPLTASRRVATAGYLELLRVRRIAGRLIEAGDGAGAPRVAVVNDAFVERSWPGQDSIGKRFHISGDPDDVWTTVIGVVGTVEENPGDTRSRPTLYLPMEQAVARGVYFVVRTAGEPTALARPAREALWAVDPNLPIASVESLRGARDERYSGLRTGAAMMGGFAVMAALLAVLGIYGVIATLVTQRTHEIGVRVALGAQRRHILRLVIGRGLLLAAIGCALGLLGGAGLVGMLGGLLGRLIVSGPWLYIGVTAMVVLAAFLGSYIPARRATRVDPLLALRSD